MDHPPLETDDEALRRIRDIALAYPDAHEVSVWGRQTFRVGKKIFVVAGASLVDPDSIVFKPEPEERLAQLQDPRFFVPPYFGPGGWMALHVGPIDTDWTEVAELVDTSYRRVALKRQIAVLDARGGLSTD